MSFDGICLHYIVNELKDTILQSRIDKIYELSKDKLLLILKKNRNEFNLLISVNPRLCRMHLTSVDIKPPAHPPAFCMLLRKHLIGGTVIALSQDQLERVVYMTISNTDEFMQNVKLKLVIEIMGKHSNITLLKDGIVIDSIKRIPSNINRYREILPGERYIKPPIGDKINILNSDKKNIRSIVESNVSANTNKNVSRWLLNTFMGISGQTAQEISYRSDVNHKKKLTNLLPEEIICLTETLENLKICLQSKKAEPTLYIDNTTDKPINFWVFPLKSNEHNNVTHINYETANAVVDRFFTKTEKENKITTIKNKLNNIIKHNMKRLKRDLKFSTIKFEKTSKFNNYKICGEILTANLYKIKPGQSQVTLLNFYTGDDITIKLNEKFSPADNAQMYFKRYKKLQKSRKKININIRKLTTEIDYLENCLIGIRNSDTSDDLHEVQTELQKEGYIKHSKKKSANTKSKPLKFKSSDGFDIYVGKNNRQNDNLTFKLASPNDIWIHTKNAPGSHVIIKSNKQDVSDKTLYEACMLAAYFSKSQQSSNVSVDYTTVKHVKKPSGAKPGFVIYTNQKTLYVTPQKSLVKELSL